MVATPKYVMRRLNRTCSGHHVHVRLMGGSRTHDAEDYPDKLARAVAMLMAAPDRSDKLDDAFPLDEDDDWDARAEQPEDTTASEEPRVVDDEVWTGKDCWSDSMSRGRSLARTC